jgi:hypothetical protein
MRVGWAAFVLFSLSVFGCDSAESPAPAPSTEGPPSASALPAGADAPGTLAASPSSASPDWVVSVFTPAPPLSARRAAALASDLAERERVLRSSLTPPLRIVHAGDTFLVCAGDAGAPVDAVVSLVEKTTASLYDGWAQHRPDRGVVLWVYSTQAAFARGITAHTTEKRQAHGQDATDPKPPPSSASFGLYDPEARVIMVRTDGGGTLSSAHEIAHPLLAGPGSDFPRAPAFLVESATLFEAVTFSKAGDGGHVSARYGAHFRLQSIRDAEKSSDPEIRDSLRLDRLFAMGDDFNYGPRYLHYALAREALRYIAAKGPREAGAPDGPNALWRFWATCRDNVLADETCSTSFAKVMGGKTPEQATPEFIAWVNSREAEGDVP